MLLRTISALLLLAAIVSCSQTSISGNRSRVEAYGLAVEFRPVCHERQIHLEGSIENTTDHPLSLASGAFPWEYDLLGSRFEATSSKGRLRRDETAPLSQIVGPVQLAAREKQSGTTPVSSIFPDMMQMLKHTPVIVRWKYTLSRERKQFIEGAVEIQTDSCRS